LYSTILSITVSISGGATIQPSRQPVIAQALEKLCSTTTRSSGSATSWKEGATRLP
jgi:hypothetical protein